MCAHQMQIKATYFLCSFWIATILPVFFFFSFVTSRSFRISVVLLRTFLMLFGLQTVALPPSLSYVRWRNASGVLWCHQSSFRACGFKEQPLVTIKLRNLWICVQRSSPLDPPALPRISTCL